MSFFNWLGAAMQGLFRNPLVEAGYVGVSSGKAVGAVGGIVFFRKPELYSVTVDGHSYKCEGWIF